ncbi:hypothetical protein JVU11DRAFT_2942 [Chiua virens]|nr:hypothetical protein JVU11DRAFT_2942 [Chiua virens]
MRWRVNHPFSDHRWWTTTHSHFVLNGGFVLRDSEGLREIKVEEFLRLLDAKEIVNPMVKEADIKDKSSSDDLAKAILVAQLSWFMIQVIVRLVNHLVVTLIELDTVCMALLTLILIFIGGKNHFALGEIPTITTERKSYNFLYSTSESDDDSCDSLCLLLITWVMLGALHLLAWNYGFQTTSEMILWRVASLVLTASPIFLLVSLSINEKAGKFCGIIVALLGVISRLLLVALMLASLRSLPPSAYQIIPL